MKNNEMIDPGYIDAWSLRTPYGYDPRDYEVDASETEQRR